MTLSIHRRSVDRRPSHARPLIARNLWLTLVQRVTKRDVTEIVRDMTESSQSPGAPRQPLPGPGGVPLLLHGLALGGLAGAAHVADVVQAHYIRGTFAWASRDIFWMSPLANAALLSAVAISLLVLARAWPRGIPGHVRAGVLAAFGAVAMLLLVRGLHASAMLLLSVGLGVQYARLVRRGSGVVRVVTGAGLVVGGMLVAGGLVERATRDGRGAPDVTGSARAAAPNVVVIIWDTVRAMSVSLYGSERRTTPELEQFAARATTFDWAIAPSPWTLPSHCSMFTGLQPGEHTCRWDVPLRHAPTTVAAEFARRGWRTGAFVANRFYATHETGLDRGFQHYDDFRVTPRQVLLSSTLMQTAIGRDLVRGRTAGERTASLRRFKLLGDPKPLTDRKSATHVTDAFLDWQARRPAQPFFAFLNLFDAHDPYEPPPPWDRAFPSAPPRLSQYEGGIAYMDHELGRLLATLQQRGLLDNTIVVVTSDHGEAFGEHGLTSHGHGLYLPLVHVPLVIRAPDKLPVGQRVPAVIAMRDLAATLLDLAGIGPVKEVGGSSFASPQRLAVAADSSDPTHMALAETEKAKAFWRRGPARHGAMHSLFDDTWHYIRDGRGVEELFAYRTDAGETDNLASHDPVRVAHFRALLGRVTTRLVQ